jgi:uncharacterized damage-inducible protein DinB
MNKITMPIQTGNLESLDQMITFIDSLSDSEYQHSPKPWFDSSIGQHLRHIIDLFHALMHGTSEEVNYDIRRRGAPVETDKEIGLNELNEIRDWVSRISEDDINQDTLVHTETALYTQQTDTFKSSFGRELCFASSHLVHHLAIMAAVAKMAGKNVDSKLGLAPATATFVREQENPLHN